MTPVDRSPGEFQQRLTEYAERLSFRLAEAATGMANEFELRRHVEPVIERAVEELYGMRWNRIRSERTNVAGRFDTLYGGVLVEYEWRMDTARRRHGADQALRYLAGEAEGLRTELFTAAVTDGTTWGFLIGAAETAGSPELFSPGFNDPLDSFVWVPNSVAACRRFLELVGSHQQQPVSGDALVGAFGQRSAVAREMLARFVHAIQGRTRHDRTDTLYLEWRRELEVAYGSLDRSDSALLNDITEAYGIPAVGSLGEFLFALHTYFALVARLVAAEILAISSGQTTARPSNWSALSAAGIKEKCEALEHGQIPPGLPIGNLFEGDVFSWYIDHMVGGESVSSGIARICSRIGEFAFPRLAYGAGPSVDLLRDLYQGLSSRELRRALGEFLTPGWLAQATLETAMWQGADLHEDRTLDCTCGTGTFLIPVLGLRLQDLRRRYGTEVTAEQVQTVLNGVVGIDINPVAVIATRMNYLITLGEFASLGVVDEDVVHSQTGSREAGGRKVSAPCSRWKL